MNVSERRSQVVIISTLALLALLVVWFFLSRGGQASSTSTLSQSAATTTASLATSSPQTSSTPANFSVKPLTSTVPPPVPVYDQPLTCAATVSNDVCAQAQSQAKTFIAQIVANKENAAAWINLGTLREETGDYRGAMDAWEYVERLYPNVPTAYDNLGDLYATYLHEYKLAETSYLTSIELNPNDPSPYENLFTIYTTTSYTGGTGAAANILQKGIAANPQAVNLQVILARFYKQQGQLSDAKAMYDKAIAAAKAQGNTSLADNLAQEEAQL